MNIFLRFHHLSHRFDRQIQAWGITALGLVLRLFIAWQFLKAGIVKVSNWEGTLSLFREEYVIPVLPPELAAVMGAGGELVFSTLLILGLFARPAALGLFVVNAIAVISYPQLWTFDCPAAINDHFYWGILLLVLIVVGPGKIAVDQWLKKIAKSRP
jgi:putative oxidoreductase